ESALLSGGADGSRAESPKNDAAHYVEPRAQLGEGDSRRDQSQLALRVFGDVDGDDATRRRRVARWAGKESALRRGQDGVHERTGREPVSHARVSRGVGDLKMQTKTIRRSAGAVALVLASGCAHAGMSTQQHVEMAGRAAAGGWRLLELQSFRG